MKELKAVRNSNLELFRIITMLVIVAHHYVVNSGVIQIINEMEVLKIKDYFLLVFGWGGKTGINCFVLITGYFMCTSRITVKKFMKLLSWKYFYAILFSSIFVLAGYVKFGLKDIIKILFPFYTIESNFVACFIIFYLFIPFINKMIHNLTEREHFLLTVLCLFVYTVLPSMSANVSFNYVTWFGVLYLVASYLRLYPKKIFDNFRIWKVILLVNLLLSWVSVILFANLERKIGTSGITYFWVSDSNKILAFTTSVSAFLFFKNLNLRQSKTINTIAASAFGVLLIHANSDTMRKWLWEDVLQNVKYYDSAWWFVHAILSVLGIYVVCTIIDMIRVHFVETPFFNWCEKKRAKI